MADSDTVVDKPVTGKATTVNRRFVGTAAFVPAPASLRLRGAALLGGMLIVTGGLLSAPTAAAVPSSEAVDAINDRYTGFGGEMSLLGAPVSEAVDVAGGAERAYEGGAVYYSKDTGAHVMYGAILNRYRDLGGPDGSGLGFPASDVSDTGDGVGRFADFAAPQGASIYWTPQWGASVIRGKVLEAWRQFGGITGPFGYPSTDTAIAGDIETGKFVGPGGSEIQWSPAGGLVTVPADLAATLPGFGAPPPPAPETPTTLGATPPVSTPSAPPPAATVTTEWWWGPGGIAALALLAVLLWLMTKTRPTQPVPDATEGTPEITAGDGTPPPPAAA